MSSWVKSDPLKILISGAGIAGPTLAYWLLHYGFAPTLVEQSPQLRCGGYVVDFWGTGFDVAERMGLLPNLRCLGYDVAEVRIVNARGKRCGGFFVDVFRRATKGRYTSIARGDLAAIIYASIDGRVPTRFGDHITTLTQDNDGVNVCFAQAPTQRFDLVIGADGLHSRVRELAFGQQARFEKPLGYTVAAFQTTGYRPRDELVYVSYARPGQQVARFSMRDDRTMFLLMFADDSVARSNLAATINTASVAQTAKNLPDAAAAKRILLAAFDGGGWESASILAQMDQSDEMYFDRVSQIHLPVWAHGRIALVGDAASCPSLLAGEGSALAMTQAYVLAGELHAARGDYRVAFRAYEQRIRTFIDNKQRDAFKFASAFAPRTRCGLFVRNQISRLLAIPTVANYFIGRGVIDDFELPDYAAQHRP